MCFVLYMAADALIPDIPFDSNAPALNTQPISDRESPLQDIFHQRNVKFLGSSNHCGCGYRHLSYQNGEWPEEYLIDTATEFGAETQADHESLHRFMVDQLQFDSLGSCCIRVRCIGTNLIEALKQRLIASFVKRKLVKQFFFAT